MKRIWSVLLATLLIVAALPTWASAATNITGMSNGAVVLDDSKVADFGDIVLGVDNNVLLIPFFHDGFDGAGLTEADITEDIVNKMRLVANGFTLTGAGGVFSDVTMQHYIDPNHLPMIILTATNIGEVDGTLEIEYTDGGVTTTSAPIPIKGSFVDPTINKKITDLTGKNLADYTDDNGAPVPDRVTQNDKNVPGSDLDGGMVVRPGDEIKFKLDTEYFVWEPLINGMNSSVRKSTLDNNKVDVAKSITKGKEYIESVDIENKDGRAYVVIKFVDELVSVKEKDFALKVYLSYKGRKNNDTAVELSGKFANEEEIVGKGVDSVDTSWGLVVKTEAHLMPIRMEAGNGVTLYTILHNDRGHYAKAVDTRTADDLAIMEYFPEIRKVITLKMVNIHTSRVDALKANVIVEEEDSEKLLNVGIQAGDTELVGTEVVIDTDEPMFAYDADGVLLGTTDKRLPLRDKYFLTYQEIEFTPITTAAPEEEGLPEEGYNPTTGRASGPNMAVAGALLLLAAGFLARKG